MKLVISKRYAFILLILSLMGCQPFQAPNSKLSIERELGQSPAPVPPPNLPSDPSQPIRKPKPVNTTRSECSVFQGATSLEYFGFYCSSCNWVGKGSYTDEVSEFINLIWIAGGPIEFTINELNTAESKGLFAVISALNFDMSQTNWDKIAPLLKPYVDSGTIVGFYMADDGFGDIAETERQIHEIKKDFPRVATLAIINYTPTVLPKGLDWIGLETYLGFGADHTWLNNVMALMTPEQKILLVPGVFVQGQTASKDVVSKIPMIIDSVLEIARNNPRVIGVIPFLWQSSKSTTNPILDLTGASDLPPYREHISQIGGCFTH